MVRAVRCLIPAVLAAAALAACGSSSSSSPLDSVLSYFPKDSPFVMSIVTDPNAPAVKNGQAMLRQIPLANLGEAALISQLQRLGINYDADIRPLFGNPLLFGVEGPSTSGTARQKVLFAWATKDAGVLNSLIKKLRLQQTGSHDGATLYQQSTSTFAVDGSTFIAGSSQSIVTGALDRHAAGHGMTATDYNRELGSLPKNALIDAFGYLRPTLTASSGAAKALRVPWVGALRGYGVAISASSGGLSFQYTLDTSGAGLTSAQLPIAPGSSPPGLVGDMPILAGLREPAFVLNFALDAERNTSPAKYAADVAQMNAVRRKRGVDFRRDVLNELGNNAALESAGHGFIARVDVRNPTAVARTLRKLGTSALDVFGPHPGAHVTLGPGSFETEHRAKRQSVLFGLVGSEFVAGTATPAQLRAFAAAPATAASGAHGAAAFRIALPQLLQLTLHSKLSNTVQQILGALGDITGWVTSSPTALTGSATLAIK